MYTKHTVNKITNLQLATSNNYLMQDAASPHPQYTKLRSVAFPVSRPCILLYPLASCIENISSLHYLFG